MMLEVLGEEGGHGARSVASWEEPTQGLGDLFGGNHRRSRLLDQDRGG